MGKIQYTAAAAALFLCLAGCGVSVEDGQAEEQKAEESAEAEEREEEQEADRSSSENREKTGETGAEYGGSREKIILGGNSYTVEEDQSFDTDLNHFGRVRFVTADPDTSGGAEFFLDRGGRLIYRFPEFPWAAGEEERCGAFLKTEAVAFRDVNGDGKEDVLALARYENGRRTQLYLGTESGFAADVTAALLADEAGADGTVDQFLKFDGKRRKEEAERMREVLGLDEAAVRDFAGQFAECAASGERERAVSMIEYPVEVRTPSASVRVSDEEELLPYFDQVFSPEFIRQLRDDMSRIGWTDRGAFLGDGSLWLAKKGSRIAIISAASGESGIFPPGQEITAGPVPVGRE